MNERDVDVVQNADLSNGNRMVEAFMEMASAVMGLRSHNLIISAVQGIFAMTFCFCLVTWAYSESIWDPETPVGSFMGGMSSITLFSSGTRTLDLVQLSILMVLTACHVAGMFIVLRRFAAKAVTKIDVWIACILFEVSPYIILVPIWGALGSTLQFLSEDDPLTVFFFIVFTCMAIYIIVITYFSMSLIYFGTKPSPSPLYSVYGSYYVVFFTGCAVSVLLERISRITGIIGMGIMVFVHLAFAVYLLIDVYSLPHADVKGSAFSMGVNIAMLVSDALAIVHAIVLHLDERLRLGAIMGALLLGTIFGFFSIRSIRNKIVSVLERYRITGADPAEYYAGLQIKSESVALKYLVVGFMEGVTTVLDGTFMTAVTQKVDSQRLWRVVAQLSMMLPANAIVSEQAIVTIHSWHDRSLVQRTILFRLVRVHSKRNHGAKRNLIQRIADMQAMTESTVESVRWFWRQVAMGDIRSSAKTLRVLTKAITDSRRAWKESMAGSGTDSKLAAGYGRFCIECLGKFEKGLVNIIRSRQMRSNDSHSVDPLFQMFIIARPMLWTNGILDREGRVLAAGVAEASSDSSAHDQNSTQDDTLWHIDAGALYATGKELMEWPKLRIGITRATSKYRPSHLLALKIMSTVAFVVMLLILCLGIWQFSGSLRSTGFLYDRLETTGEVRICLGMLRAMIFVFYAGHKDIDLLFSEADFEAALPVEALKETSAFVYKSHAGTYAYMANRFMEGFVALYDSIAASGRDGANVTRITETLAARSIRRLRYDTTQVEPEWRTMSVKDAIVATFWTFQSYLGNPDIVKDWVDSKIMLDVLIVHDDLVEAFETVCSDFSDQVIEDFDATRQWLLTVVVVTVVFNLCVCVPLKLSHLVATYIEFQRIQRALITVPREEAGSAVAAIIEQNPIDAVQSRNSQGTLEESQSNLFWLIISLLLSIIVAILSGCSIVAFDNYGNNAVETVCVSRFGTARSGLVGELIAEIIMIMIERELTGRGDTSGLDAAVMDGVWDTMIGKMVSNGDWFSQGKDGGKGMFSIHPDIHDFHMEYACESTSTNTEHHDYYKCLSPDRAVTHYIVLLERLKDTPTQTLKQSLLVNTLHFASTEVQSLLFHSRELVTEVVADATASGEMIPMVLLGCAIVVVICDWIINNFLNGQVTAYLKTALLVMRRLPPPVIAESEVLIDILMAGKKRAIEEIADPEEVVFKHSLSAMINVNDSYMVEAVNGAFKNIFRLVDDQIVGHDLSVIIPRPEVKEGKVMNENVAGTQLYATMDQMKQSNTDQPAQLCISIRCGDETYTSADVTIHPVRGRVGRTSNFVIIGDDQREIGSIEEKVDTIHRETKMVSTKLVPTRIASVFKDNGDDYVYVVPQVTLITLQFSKFMDLLNDPVASIDTTIDMLDEVAVNIQATKVKSLFDTTMYMTGLLPGHEDGHAQKGINLAVALRGKVRHQLHGRDRFRMSVYTGGPAACILVPIGEGKSRRFEVVGEIIDIGAELLELAPGNCIVMSSPTHAALETMPAKVVAGPDFRGTPTFIV